MQQIVLNGSGLTPEAVWAVAHAGAKVLLCPKALKRVAESSDFVQSQVRSKQVIYGVTTGFGANATKVIDDYQQAQALQRNLLLSHASGVGTPFDIPTTRASMLIRLNTLMAGHSGIRPVVLERLALMLNEGVHPIIPSQGSVGASGDLCPLAHMSLPIIGEGEVEWQGKQMSSMEWLSQAGLTPLELLHKEGLALLNGTSPMNALGVLAVIEADRLLHLACLSAALCFEALCARSEAFDARLHELRRHPSQIYVAELLRQAIDGSQLVGIQPWHILRRLPKTLQSLLEDENPTVSDALKKLYNEQRCRFPQEIYEKLPQEHHLPGWQQWKAIFRLIERKISPQDAYSIRCTPQVLGASHNAIQYVRYIMHNELNAVVDNPLLFVDTHCALSGGNFHGQPLALALDYLKIALCEIGNLLERQINKLVDEHTNDALPAFLTEDSSGLHSGLMIPQYVAAALVSENKVLAHPASVDSIPTCANQEDHVSMGTIAGRQAKEILSNVQKILCIHLLCSSQAVDLRLRQLSRMGDFRMGKGSQLLYEALRKHIAFIEQDRLLEQDLKRIQALRPTLEQLAWQFFGCETSIPHISFPVKN